MREPKKHLVFEALMKNIKNIYNSETNLADQDPHKKNGNLLSGQSIECPIR